jgi:hypothetical protein
MGFDLTSLIPYMGATGQALRDLDTGKTGADDFAGELLLYGAEVGQAVIDNGTLPELPEVLRRGTTEKITGALAASLKVANAVLTLARFQAHGKAAQILKYVNEALSLLIAQEPVPTPPAALLGKVSATTENAPVSSKKNTIGK